VKKLRSLFEIAAVLVVGMFCTAELQAQRVNIPTGTVVDLRMDTGLNSGRARVNDAFMATVTRAVWIDGRIAVPRDSKVDGHVSMVQPATHGSKSGVIAVSFTQITIDGRRYAINGALTSLRDAERRQILDQEGTVQGGSSAGRNTVFIGGGAGAGAVIGAMAGGGKGAGAGAAIGGGLGIVGALLAHGVEAQVPAGSEMAMELLRGIGVTVSNVGPGRQQRSDDRALYVSANLVRGAQTELQNLHNYQGPVNGVLDTGTRRAIAHFQIDNNPHGTGDLDQETAVELGLVRYEEPGGQGRGNGGYGH
jgi:type IV secretion system protein VirB10